MSKNSTKTNGDDTEMHPPGLRIGITQSAQSYSQLPQPDTSPKDRQSPNFPHEKSEDPTIPPPSSTFRVPRSSTLPYHDEDKRDTISPSEERSKLSGSFNTKKEFLVNLPARDSPAESCGKINIINPESPDSYKERGRFSFYSIFDYDPYKSLLVVEVLNLAFVVSQLLLFYKSLSGDERHAVEVSFFILAIVSAAVPVSVYVWGKKGWCGLLVFCLVAQSLNILTNITVTFMSIINYNVILVSTMDLFSTHTKRHHFVFSLLIVAAVVLAFNIVGMSIIVSMLHSPGMLFNKCSECFSRFRGKGSDEIEMSPQRYGNHTCTKIVTL